MGSGAGSVGVGVGVGSGAGSVGVGSGSGGAVAPPGTVKVRVELASLRPPAESIPTTVTEYVSPGIRPVIVHDMRLVDAEASHVASEGETVAR